MPSKLYVVEYQGERTELEYLSDDDVAVKEGGGAGVFQELELLEYIRDMALYGTYIDGGANVGNHSIYFARHCRANWVHSVEAHPKIYDVLRRNIVRNGISGIRTYNRALWNERKEAWMDDPVPGNAGRTQLGGDGRQHAKKRKFTVDAVTLDQMFPSIDDCVVLKLDVEDCEVQAVQGAQRLIERCRPVIIAEHHTPALKDAFHAEIMDMGYEEERAFDPRGETSVWLS